MKPGQAASDSVGLRPSARFLVAFAALALALALLAPSLAPLSGSMDAFAQDLANGSFRPFGQLGGPGSGPAPAFASSLGGLTGSSPGNYLPGSATLPNSWPLDRDGRGGTVTIDSVFDPDLGAMKRLKAYDEVSPEGTSLLVADPTLRPATVDPTLRYDRAIVGSFPVQFHAGVPVPIFSPHPKARIASFSVDPPLSGGVQFFRDGADTLYALGHEDRIATLNVTFQVSSDYYSLPPIADVHVSDYSYGPDVPQPVVPAQLQQDAKLVLARAGVKDPSDVGGTLDALSTYFRSFTEGDIPPPSEVESLYLALALGGHGCCRHRAYAFMVTAEAVGIPSRVVVNEAHAFVEVELPDGHWHQINLGGCGAYVLNNPNHYPPLFPQATQPRSEANPDENAAVQRVATFTRVTEAPARIVKGQVFLVNGTVLAADGRGVPGARVDLFLNQTKSASGFLTGAGAADSSGRFSLQADVPPDAPAQSYQLVAHGTDGYATNVRYDDSWSDPSVDVFAPTRFVFGPLAGATGFPANVTGHLVDVDLTPIANATVHWSFEGTAERDLVTDAAGAFVGRIVVNQTGSYAMSFAFDGDGHHGPSTGNATLDVRDAAIQLPAEVPVLTRGEPGTLSGDLAVAGGAPRGAVVAVHVLSSTDPGAATLGAAQGAIDAAGHFVAPLTLDARLAPGLYPARYEASVVSPTLTATGFVRLVAGATVALAVPSSVAPGAGWTVVATLVNDNGTAVSGVVMRLTFDGNDSTSRSLLTNRTGVARFDVAGGLAPGGHTLRVAFLGDGDHVATSVARSFTIAAPWYGTLSAWLLGVGLAVALLAVALGAAFRRGGPARRFLHARFAHLALPQRRFLAVSFPDHPPGVAPVFEPGEPVRLRVVARDRAMRPRRLRVALAPGEGRVRSRSAVATEEAGALFEVTAPAEPGTLALRLRARGIERLWTRPVELAVRVESYREAVEAGFVALRRRANLPPATTPAELVARLAPRLDAAGRGSLATAAELFDVADYSEARVDRAFYHRFAVAAAAVAGAIEEVVDGAAA